MIRAELIFKRVLLFSFFIFSVPSFAYSAPCTDGVDCFCDLVEGRGPLGAADPAFVASANRVTCVDWEEATLGSQASTLPITSDTINAGGQNVGRPWDATSSACGNTNRGGNSWFSTRHGNGSGIWQAGQPTSPARGAVCGCGAPFQGCTGTRSFHPSNFWGAGNNFALAIRRPGEENAFEPAHAPVPILFGEQDSALIGQGGSGYRISSGSVNITHMGYTSAMLYSENHFTQLNSQGVRVSTLPIKGNEFLPGGFWLFGRQSNSPESEFPFTGFFFFGAGGTQAECNSRISSGQISASIGSVSCISTAVIWGSRENYDLSDWPAGTKGCVRGELSGMGSGSMRLREWFQHATDTNEVLVLDAVFNVPANFFNFQNVTLPFFDTYTNGLDGTPSADGQKHYRIEDNIVIVKNRAPVSCGQIGFNGSNTDTTPPSPPSNLTKTN